MSSRMQAALAASFNYSYLTGCSFLRLPLLPYHLTLNSRKSSNLGLFTYLLCWSLTFFCYLYPYNSWSFIYTLNFPQKSRLTWLTIYFISPLKYLTGFWINKSKNYLPQCAPPSVVSRTQNQTLRPMCIKFHLPREAMPFGVIHSLCFFFPSSPNPIHHESC